MGRPRKPYTPTKDDHIVARGLDPRSIYPRCDFCAGQKRKPGVVQAGRWWAHEACAIDPDNLKLASAKLPAIDYSDFADRPNAARKVAAMLARVRDWANAKRQAFHEALKHRADIFAPDECPEYRIPLINPRRSFSHE